MGSDVPNGPSDAWIVLPAALDTSRRLCEFIRSWLRDVKIGDAQHYAEVSIVVAELVTNAMTHGIPPIELHLWQRSEGIRVGVADGSSAVPKLRAMDVDLTSGRGLRIVDGIASEWGTKLTDHGKLVWAEISGSEGTA